MAEEARAHAKLSHSEQRQQERLAFRAARWQRLQGGGGAWARDGTFLRHKPTDAVGGASCSSFSSSSSSSSSARNPTNRGDSNGGGRRHHEGCGGSDNGGRPGALGPCKSLLEAAWPMPGCARAKPYYKLSESKIAYGKWRCRTLSMWA